MSNPIRRQLTDEEEKLHCRLVKRTMAVIPKGHWRFFSSDNSGIYDYGCVIVVTGDGDTMTLA